MHGNEDNCDVSKCFSFLYLFFFCVIDVSGRLAMESIRGIKKITLVIEK